ncbi:hypothetical protein L202_02487 [Cryptococcus amylolentus CBS 6039]|uniref:Protein CSN12 homolog n=2 Tax=Cryptococcus amylolentus TaxID=104669 RepID=A0A1E3I0V7_9TREE|nr:hypothetical protein L202_02487 [Cryptococcus amylolentus CBS 6039]ODN82197.1 hypothetical protein L202_02487 [Cryptococcus amylolentus CBS 6039]ODO09716.1 hypothetical protein I350_01932 [Cryptococcus amylolentus CBS 6273]
MKLSQYISAFSQPLQHQDATALDRLLSIHSRTSRGLSETVGELTERQLKNPGITLEEPWSEIAARHCACVHAQYKLQNFAQAFEHQNTKLTLFYRWLPDQSSWVLPVLYTMLVDLRYLAERADAPIYNSTGKMPSLEICTRTVSKAFSMCATDRTFKGSESRRQGIYHTATLALKCYFKVSKPNLCKNIIRAVVSDPKTPSVSTAPIGDQVTWKYYLGMLAFLNGDEKKAGEELEWALEHCPAGAVRNTELILSYLIPLRLLQGILPSPQLLGLHPRLQTLFTPFITALRSGNLSAYDNALTWGQVRLVSMNIFLTMERAREVCLRVLFKQAWVAMGKESRVPIGTFQMALRLSGAVVEGEEVECMVANMIYRGYIKGYISHEKQIVVLGKTNPFPKTSTILR